MTTYRQPTATWTWSCDLCRHTETSHFTDDATFLWRAHVKHCPANTPGDPLPFVAVADDQLITEAIERGDADA